MKNLIFIDNDDKNTAEETVNNYVKHSLKYYSEISKSTIDSIKIIPDFWRMNRDDVFSMAFDSDNIIITCSVYTQSTVANSKSQILGVLRTAGQSHVKDCTYIDMTGDLVDMLHRYLRDMDAKGVIHILRGIELNNIITLDDTQFKQINIEINDSGIFKLTDISLKNLIEP